MTDEFAKTPPPPPNFGVSMLKDQLVIILPHRHKAGVETVHGMRDVLDVSVVALTGTFAGQEFVAETFMAPKLVNQLKESIGQVMLGRIALAPGAKPGALGPLVLADASAADHEIAQQWITARPGRIGQLKSEGARIAAARAAERDLGQAAQAQGYGYPPGYGGSPQNQGSPQFSQPSGQQFPQPPAPVSPPPF